MPETRAVPSLFSWAYAAAVLAYVAGSMLQTPGVTAPTPGYVIAGGGLLALAAALGIALRPLTSRRARIIALAVLFLAWCYLARLTSIETYLSSVSWAEWAACLSVLCAILLSVSSSTQWRFVAWGLAITALLASLYGLYLVQTDATLHSRFSSTFTNPDCFAVVPLVGALLASGLAGRSPGLKRYLALALATGLIAALLFTASRSALIGLVAGYLFLGGFLVSGMSSGKKASKNGEGASGPRKRRRRSRKDKRAFPIGAVLPILAVVCLFFLMPSNPMTRRFSKLAADTKTWSSRADALERGLKAFTERPLLGSGPGTFALAYQPYRTLDGIQEYYNVAHNDHLQVLVETGVVGLGLWLGLLGVCAASGVRRAGSRMSSESLAASAAVVGVSVYALGNFALPVPAATQWWMAAAGLAACTPGRKGGAGPAPLWLRACLAAALFLVGLSLVFCGLRIERAKVRIQEARKFAGELKLEQAYEAATAAVHTEPANTQHRRERSQLAKKLAYLTGVDDWASRAEADLLAARQQNPRGVPVLMALFRYYYSAGDLEHADEVLDAALAQAPHSLEMRRRLAGIKLARGNYGEAAELLVPLVGKGEGQERDQIAASIVLMEHKEKGSGIQLLREWSADKSRASLVAGVVQKIHQLAAGKPQLATLDDTLYRFQLESSPDDACVLLGYARAAAARGDSEKQLRLLQQIVEDRDATQSGCWGKAMAEWAGVVSRQGDTERARLVLASHLERDPGALEVRLQLSKILEAEDTARARELIKEGLLFREDAQLLLRMGELYEAEGFPDLAMSYYRDAERASPQDEQVNNRIERLLREGARPARGRVKKGNRREPDPSSTL
ncbi:MAG: O-antigen ligase family protein [Armatimonadetes bacterium]|nr:O-antigen ligase family protein [Armatimonadota bacterium]